MVTPARSAVDDGSGNVHLIITVNPKVNLIEEEGGEDRHTPAELFVIYMRTFPFTSYFALIEMLE